MTKGQHLGEFEFIVLATVMRLWDDAYGARVRRDIEDRIHRQVSLGAVYATLDRLELKGYVRSGFGDPTPERGGKAKRFYRVEGAGKQALKDSYDIVQTMVAGVKLSGGVA